MQLLRKIRIAASAAGILAATTLAVATPSTADIVANLGTLNIGQTELVSCNTTVCVATTGAIDGSIPGTGLFTHQIHFGVSAVAGTIASTIVLNPAANDIANLTVQLFEYVAGPTAPGAINATGNLLGAAVLVELTAISATFDLAFSPLSPAPGSTYFIQIVAGGTGTFNYSQLVSISPVPLPPALFLLAAAVCGLVGYARIRRGRHETI